MAKIRRSQPCRVSNCCGRYRASTARRLVAIPALVPIPKNFHGKLSRHGI